MSLIIWPVSLLTVAAIVDTTDRIARLVLWRVHAANTSHCCVGPTACTLREICWCYFEHQTAAPDPVEISDVIAAISQECAVVAVVVQCSVATCKDLALRGEPKLEGKREEFRFVLWRQVETHAADKKKVAFLLTNMMSCLRP
jgi:hypothetical protein